MKKILLVIMAAVVMMLSVGSEKAIASTETAGAGSNLSTAVAFQLGETLNGNLIYGISSRIYYKFVLSTNAIVRVNAQTGGHNQGVYVTVRDGDGDKVDFLGTEDENNWGFQSLSEDLALSAGTYFLEVERTSYDDVKFSLSVNTVVNTTESVKVAGQENKYFNVAVPFEVGNQLQSIAINKFSIMDWNYYDCHRYMFQLNKKQTVVFKTKSGVVNDKVGVRLYDSSGNSVKCSEKSTSKWCSYITKTLKAGTYYLGVWTYDYDVPYTIYTSYNVGNVQKVKVSSPSKGKIKISWKKVNGSGYEIQYCTKKSFKGSKVYKKTVKASKKTYTKSGFKRKKKYYVRVRAYKNINGKRVNGSWSKVVSVRTK